MKESIQTSRKVSLGKRLDEDTNIFNPICYKAIGKGNWYQQDLEYITMPAFRLELLPANVQLEYCYKAKIVAEYLLTFQNKEGYVKALTGLRKTIYTDWHYGDLRTFMDCKTILNLVLIQFSVDRSNFRLYLFESYYPKGNKRITTVNKIIQEINTTGQPPRKVLKCCKCTSKIIEQTKPIQV
ncbi:MAG: hypothetical protein CL555_13855 [Algoriphagus sp.]|nr:hypothetical protein [Algoriphagus sp.]